MMFILDSEFISKEVFLREMVESLSINKGYKVEACILVKTVI